MAERTAIMRRSSRPRLSSTNKQASTVSSANTSSPARRRSDRVRQQRRERTDSGLLYRPGLAAVTILVSMVRLYIVLHPDSWWQTHADEIYQSVEMAHINLYGYGFRPYEYAPVPGIDGEPDNSTLSRQIVNHELLQHGMYALRSHIVPAFYTIALWIGRYIAPSLNHIILAKIIHISVTSWLPVAVCLFTKQCWQTFLQPSVEKEEVEGDQQVAEHEEVSGAFVDDVAGLALLLTALSEPLLVLSTHTLVNSLLSPLAWISMAGLCASLKPTCSQESDGTAKGGRQLRCAVLSGAALGLLGYIRLDTILFIGVLFSSLHAPFVSLLKDKLAPFLIAAFSFVCGFVVGGLVDKLTYGQWFISPIQWFRFNVEKDYATAIFGEYPSWEYLERIFLNDPVLALLTLLTVGLWLRSLCRKHRQDGAPTRSSLSTQNRQAVGRLLAVLLFLFLIYSSKGHKELRFLHDWIVMLLIVIAAGVYTLVVSIPKSKSFQKLIICGILLAFAVSTFWRFPRAHDGSNRVWAWQRSRKAADVNRCLDWLSKQHGKKQPTGIFIDHDIYGVAGHSVLHQPDVDIISLLNERFREWDGAARRRYKSALPFLRKPALVNTFDDCSFTCSIEAVLRLTKHLLMSPRYNYVVMPVDRAFIDSGYDKVKQFGAMHVLRRSLDKGENKELIALGQKTSLGTNINADTLQREGEMLIMLGKGEQAVEVLSELLRVDRSRPNARELLNLAKNITVTTHW